MSLFDQFEMDTKKETEGVDITYGANKDGTIPTFHILRRGASNQNYVKTLDRNSKPYRRQIQLGTLDVKTSERVLMMTFCQTILTGWHDVQRRSGEVVQYSYDNAMKLFVELPELYTDLLTQSAEAAAFRTETMEDDAKNS